MPVVIKYIAEGFVKDAEKLFIDFEKENSPQFLIFTRVWKRHNFAAIFLGRSSSELQQFTHEIFQLTLKFMESSALLRQIASVYLLYSLFRNQILNPPTRIRVMLKQYQNFVELRKLALQQNYKTLHYVIGFLLQHGFDCVAHPILVGPRNSRHKMEIESKALQMSCMFSDLKKDTSALLQSNLLKDIKEISKVYSDLTKDVPFKNNLFKDTDLNIEKSLNELSKLSAAEKRDRTAETNSQSEMEQYSIGKKRSEIKSKAFASKAWFRQLNVTDDDDDEDNVKFTRSRAQRQTLSATAMIAKDSSDNQEDEEINERKEKVRRRKRRIPKEMRRVGRPKKGVQQLEDLLIEDDDNDGRKRKGVRRPGPKSRTCYFDGYIPQTFKPPQVEITMLSDTSEEEEESAIESEEVIKLEDA